MVLHKFFSVAQTNDNVSIVYKFYIFFTIKAHILIAKLSHNWNIVDYGTLAKSLNISVFNQAKQHKEPKITQPHPGH